MRKCIFVLSLFSIFLLFRSSPVVGDDSGDNPQRDDEIYRLLNADHKKGLNEFNVLNIEPGRTSRKDIEEIFGQPLNKGKEEYVYQNIKVNGLYGLDKKLEYVTALPLMFVVGFPELPGVSVEEHPEAYDDYQYLIVGFNLTGKVNKIVYKHFRNILLSSLDDNCKVTHCYTVAPPTRAEGWEKCSEQESLIGK